MTDLSARLQTVLGQSFRLERELGGGGMSRVFLFEQTDLGRRVVVKVLPEELAAASSADRFQRETRVVASLQHPNIVPLISAGGEEDLLWFSMPFIEGESLRDRLERDGELPISEAVRLWTEILDALAYAHGRGIVHRDIKPENILISGRHAMVADFGVARALAGAADATRATGTGMAIGTPAYMSPEQAVGEPNVDHRSDLYAAGLVMYEMLCGVGPYNERNPARLIVAHATQPVPDIRSRRAQVSPALEALVLRCLEKRAADRPQSADEVIAALGALTTGDVTTPPGASTAARMPAAGMHSSAPERAGVATAQTPARRRWILGAVAVVAVVGVIAGWLSRGGRDSNGLGAAPDTAALGVMLLPSIADARDSLFVQSALNSILGRLRDNPQIFLADPRELPPLTMPARLLAGRQSRDSLLRWLPDMRFHAHLTFTLIRAEPGYLLSAMVRTVRNDSTVVATQRSAANVAEIPAAIEAIVEETYQALTRAVGRVQAPEPTGELFGISADAARLWTEGQRLFQQRDFLPAVERLRAVVRLEPQFPEGWSTLHFALVNAGINRDERLRALANAYRLRDSLPIPPMRDRVAADYLRTIGDNAGAIEIYQRNERQGISINPNNYAIALQSLHRFEDAARLFARIRDTTYRRPNFGNSNYVSALLDLGRVDEATLEAARMDSIAGPMNPTARIARSTLVRYSRDPDSILAAARRELAGELSAGRRLGMLENVRVAELTRGALGESQRAHEQRRSMLQSVAPSDVLEDDLIDLAARARTGIELEALRRELDRVYSRSAFEALAPMDRPYSSAIIANALLGRLDEAKRLATEADREIPEEFRPVFADVLNGARGEIALAEGKGDEALRYFRAADRKSACVPCWYGEYALAFDVMGNADSAVVAWERYIGVKSHRMAANDANFLPTAYRRAGELREARGDVTRALEHYRAFVHLWRDADPVLKPRVDEVKRRIARLERGQG